MREIERTNPDQLYGIFGDAQWSNKERLSDELLLDLIENFSELPLSNSSVQPDVLGQAYEYLIKKFADATNKKAGEFYTPRSVVRLMVNILDPKEGETIYDPACGTGGMLLEAVHHVREAGGAPMIAGKLAAALGAEAEAAWLLSTGEAVRAQSGYVLDPLPWAEYEHAVQNARGQLGDDSFSRLWQEGQTLTDEEAALRRAIEYLESTLDNGQ
jgi:hypothetical protein